MAAFQFKFSDWKKENNKLIDDMFSGSLGKAWEPKDISAYMRLIMNFYSYEIKRGMLTYHDLQYKIGDYFRELGLQYRAPFNWNNTFEFDLMAQTANGNIIVKVWPSITMDDMDLARDYARTIMKSREKARVFIASDIISINSFFGNPIKDMLVQAARDFKIGLIFSSRDQSWIIPAEFISDPQA